MQQHFIGQQPGMNIVLSQQHQQRLNNPSIPQNYSMQQIPPLMGLPSAVQNNFPNPSISQDYCMPQIQQAQLNPYYPQQVQLNQTPIFNQNRNQYLIPTQQDNTTHPPGIPISHQNTFPPAPGIYLNPPIYQTSQTFIPSSAHQPTQPFNHPTFIVSPNGQGMVPIPQQMHPFQAQIPPGIVGQFQSSMNSERIIYAAPQHNTFQPSRPPSKNNGNYAHSNGRNQKFTRKTPSRLSQISVGSSTPGQKNGKQSETPESTSDEMRAPSEHPSIEPAQEMEYSKNSEAEQCAEMLPSQMDINFSLQQNLSTAEGIPNLKDTINQELVKSNGQTAIQPEQKCPETADCKYKDEDWFLAMENAKKSGELCPCNEGHPPLMCPKDYIPFKDFVKFAIFAKDQWTNNNYKPNRIPTHNQMGFVHGNNQVRNKNIGRPRGYQN